MHSEAFLSILESRALRLYTPLCRSIGWLVGRLVRWLVSRLVEGRYDCCAYSKIAFHGTAQPRDVTHQIKFCGVLRCFFGDPSQKIKVDHMSLHTITYDQRKIQYIQI